MADREKTFKIDNVVIEAAPTLFGRQTPQLYLPGMEPFGPFDLWAVMGCYALLDPKKPAATVTITYTQFLEVLGFARTISEALGHYRTFPTDNYTLVRESLNRLFTVEAVYSGEWFVRTGKQGRPKRQVVEYHFRVLSSYAYIYPSSVIPPDQLPEAKRRNVNRAKTLKNEEGPPVWERVDMEPDAIQFRVSEELLRGIMKTDPHIGSTILPVKVFELRRQLASKDSTTIRLLLWTCRQTPEAPRIGLDKLVARLYPGDKKNRSRNREAVLRSLGLLKSFGVIVDHQLEYSPKTQDDIVTISKSPDWHFPAFDDGEEGEAGLLPVP
jgi:hypothetical protein